MTCEHFKQTLHIDNDSIVEYILIIFHGSGCILLESFLDMLLNLLATFILLCTILEQDGVNGLFNSLLVTLFSNTHDLTNDNILKFVLKKVSLSTIRLDFIIWHYVLLDLLRNSSELVVRHFKTFLFGILLPHMVQTILDIILITLKKFLAGVLHELVVDLDG